MSDTDTTSAAYLAHGNELKIVWANDEYLAMLDEPFRSGNVVGKRLDEVSPMAALRCDALRRVMSTGSPQGGSDRTFSVEDGTMVHEWRAYCPLADHVLVVITSRRASASN